MPEYHLDVHDYYGTWRKLDAFTQGYIEAMFFTEHAPSVHYADIEERGQEAYDDMMLDGSIPCDASFSDLAPDSLKQIISDCEMFQGMHDDLLDAACRVEGYNMNRAGNDFWYTRCGHGVGFWDRGLGDVDDKLTKACGFRTMFPNRDVHLGDDNKVYVS